MIFSAATLGGVNGDDYSIVGQTIVQIQAIVVTIIWTAIVSVVAFKIADLIVGLRVDTESERIGLDQTSHGESAYHA